MVTGTTKSTSKTHSLRTDNQLAHLITVAVDDVVTNSIYVKRVSGTGDVRLRDVNNINTVLLFGRCGRLEAY